MTQLRVWLRMNEAANEIIEKERFLTTIDAWATTAARSCAGSIFRT